MTDALRSQFSTCYAEARTKLLASAEAANATVESHVLDTHTGALGETLATDTVLIAPEGAENLLVITSGTHGVEGFPGSGCQIGLLRDANMLGIAKANRVAILLIHAVNPHGFSHIRRTNEDNIDINRNCVDFAHPLPANADYREVHDLLVPKIWPPTEANERALDAWRETNGAERLRTALTIGQYHTPNGLFYGGTAPSWSHRTLRAILKRHLPEYRGIGLIDFHTGLGPSGHGEKIFIGGPDAAMEQPRARAIWGSDIVPIGTTGAASVTVSGPIVRLVYEEAAPGSEVTTIALEYGTNASDGASENVRFALRADQWLHNNRDTAPPALAYAIKRQLRDAFFVDDDAWKGMVYGQFRAAVLQALRGLVERI